MDQKELFKVMTPVIKKGIIKRHQQENAELEGLLENIRNLLEVLVVQNQVMMSDDQFKQFIEDMEEYAEDMGRDLETLRGD